jgi:hypothetical protein
MAAAAPSAMCRVEREDGALGRIVVLLAHIWCAVERTVRSFPAAERWGRHGRGAHVAWRVGALGRGEGEPR